ncbi:uncharacterized protein KQ657_002114 [Scheffersomyces spartinae]|uniref:Pre-rRNA-processing protein TSR2 n=1 Tax=Scheffersomyces spartinae TaxID=45513 RepID=A0A9P7VED3_9ASCO|nr:uncharacterized protein KQ657_002114 [Scheffersomyces spartinae]KAG7195731.1 hypothetical protein KQ657_002114 [Scheffersomyces spartinae]
MNQIDPAEYVEAPEGVETLRFNDAVQQAKFELGVCMAVYKWEELNTAVENSWGGPNSSEKRDWISGIVIELFNEKIVDVTLIEETLLYAMVDEFDTEIDNDSALEIGALVIKFYKQVMLQQYGVIESMYHSWVNKKNTGDGAPKVVIAADPNNPDVSDEDDDEDDDGNINDDMNDSMDIEPESKQGPIVDDDGFELVQKKGRRR